MLIKKKTSGNKERCIMSKEQEIMDFLSRRVFNPILDSPRASQTLKKGVRFTIMRLEQRDAVGMISYFWSAIVGTEQSIQFTKLMKEEGFDRFEEVFEDFRDRFNDEWIRS
jgi:hypothetical protein